METQTTTATTTTEHKDVYAIITNKIIEQLDGGTVPWRKPWTEAGLPQNLITKRYYQGINMMLLAMEQYADNQFITFRQLKDIGGKVRKGEKAHMIVYWNKVDTKQEENQHAEENKEQKQKSILRYYYVFNIAQCEKIPEQYVPKVRETHEIPSCESIVTTMPQCPPIRHKENSAFYDAKEDFVNMPKKRSFKKDTAYYSVLFHELVHSTGHESRLNRATISQMAEFGGEAYSQEELVAEIGTCYLQSHAGITSEFQNSTAYIQGWLSKLKNDKRFIFLAASAGQKAVDFILNLKEKQEETSEGEEG
jgi:antirestriction protein ArdC